MLFNVLSYTSSIKRTSGMYNGFFVAVHMYTLHVNLNSDVLLLPPP